MYHADVSKGLMLVKVKPAWIAELRNSELQTRTRTHYLLGMPRLSQAQPPIALVVAEYAQEERHDNVG